MRGFGRLVELHRLLLAHRTPVSTREIADHLQCSRATVMRLLNDLRGMTRDPIPYDRDAGGFHYLDQDRRKSAIPSLWFSPAELSALLVIRHQLRQMQPGFLAEALATLDERLVELLRYEGGAADELIRRIRLLSLSRRTAGPVTFFPQCAEAVLARRRLFIRYRSRTSDETTDREVSPLRLVAYRDNWYLDAWCHARQGLRRFAVDRLGFARVLEQTAEDQPEAVVDEHFAAGYGIFSGPASAVAVLRFRARAARWVADELWHRDQESHFLANGDYELRVPYGNPTELLMEVLRHGSDVEVLAPAALREAIAARLAEALKSYRDPSPG